MTVTKEDLLVWDELIKSVTPLFKKEDIKVDDVSVKRLKIKPRPERIIQNIVDLHGLVLQEAYECVLKFVTVHYLLGTKTISVITGKGLFEEGKIKKEIPLWLDTPVFKEKIASYEWINAGGTVRINLKKSKRKK